MKINRLRLLIILILLLFIVHFTEKKISDNLYIDMKKLADNFKMIKVEITSETINNIGRTDNLPVRIINSPDELTEYALVKLYGLGLILDNDINGFRLNTLIKDYLKENYLGKTVYLYYPQNADIKLIENYNNYRFISVIEDGIIIDFKNILNIEFLQNGFADFIYPQDNHEKIIKNNSWKYEYISAFNNEIGYWSELFGNNKIIDERSNKIVIDSFKYFYITMESNYEVNRIVDYIGSIYNMVVDINRLRYKFEMFDLFSDFIDKCLFLNISHNEKVISKYQRYYFYRQLGKILTPDDLNDFNKFIKTYKPVIYTKILESEADFVNVRAMRRKNKEYDELITEADELLQTLPEDTKYRQKLNKSISNYKRALELTENQPPIFAKLYKAYTLLYESYDKKVVYKIKALNEAEKYKLFANADKEINEDKFQTLRITEQIAITENYLNKGDEYFHLISADNDENAKKCFEYYTKAIDSAPDYDKVYLKLAGYYSKLYSFADSIDQKNERALKYKTMFAGYYSKFGNDDNRANELAENEMYSLTKKDADRLIIITENLISKHNSPNDGNNDTIFFNLDNIIKLSVKNEKGYELYFDFLNKILPEIYNYRKINTYLKVYASLYKNYLTNIKRIDNETAYLKSSEIVYNKYLELVKNIYSDIQNEESFNKNYQLAISLLKDAQFINPDSIKAYRMQANIYKMLASKADDRQLKKDFIQKANDIMNDYKFIQSQKKVDFTK